MMTPEEIAEGQMIAAAALDDAKQGAVFTDEIEGAVLLLPKALASLTEAYARLDQVKDIHVLFVEGTMEWCAACTTSWPCATLQVLWNHSLAEPLTYE